MGNRNMRRSVNNFRILQSSLGSANGWKKINLIPTEEMK